jgi:hypothetical protein
MWIMGRSAVLSRCVGGGEGEVHWRNIEYQCGAMQSEHRKLCGQGHQDDVEHRTFIDENSVQ